MLHIVTDQIHVQCKAGLWELDVLWDVFVINPIIAYHWLGVGGWDNIDKDFVSRSHDHLQWETYLDSTIISDIKFNKNN